MKGFRVSVWCVLLLVGFAHSQASSYPGLLNINLYRELCLVPCRLTCSVFSLGCSLPNCQVCHASCENVCDTRDRLSFPDVLGLGAVFPFLRWPGQNGFRSAYATNGVSNPQQSGGLFAQLFQPANTEQGQSGGGGLLNLLFGGRPASEPDSYARVRQTSPGPSLFDLLESFANFSGPLLESIAESLENSTAAFSVENPRNISTEFPYFNFDFNLTNTTSLNSSALASD